MNTEILNWLVANNFTPSPEPEFKGQYVWGRPDNWIQTDPRTGKTCAELMGNEVRWVEDALGACCDVGEMLAGLEMLYNKHGMELKLE